MTNKTSRQKVVQAIRVKFTTSLIQQKFYLIQDDRISPQEMYRNIYKFPK